MGNPDEKDVLMWRLHDPPTIEVGNPEIRVSAVQMKHHVYKVTGYDWIGEFEVFRRFKAFFLFREML